MPKYAEGKDEVFVGRIRRDLSQRNTVNMWIVSDNLPKRSRYECRSNCRISDHKEPSHAFDQECLTLPIAFKR